MTIKEIRSYQYEPKECGCVVKYTSTNTYRNITCCEKHYFELSLENRFKITVTDNETLGNIKDYFKEDEYLEEDYEHCGACGEPHLMLPE